MKTHDCDVPWAVAERLYVRLQKMPPGTTPAELTERAIELLINSDCPETSLPDVERSLRRSARFTYFRSRRRESDRLRRFEFLRSAEEMAQVSTPETVVLASEDDAHAQVFATEIRRRAHELGPKQARTFDGMLSGEAVAQTANACACSVRMVPTYRAQIRTIATNVLGISSPIAEAARRGN